VWLSLGSIKNDRVKAQGPLKDEGMILAKAGPHACNAGL
jgi:hypothetical protein